MNGNIFIERDRQTDRQTETEREREQSANQKAFKSMPIANSMRGRNNAKRNVLSDSDHEYLMSKNETNNNSRNR